MLIIKRKILFRVTIFLYYSQCPIQPGGHKRCALLQVQKTRDGSELLCRVHKRGCQGLGAVEMHSRSRARVSGASATRFDWPAQQATEPQAKRETISALCHGLVVDSTFKWNDNIAITR